MAQATVAKFIGLDDGGMAVFQTIDDFFATGSAELASPIRTPLTDAERDDLNSFRI